MAWRDSRRSRSKLFLFTTSIAVGIAALVGINSFKLNLDNEIQAQAKELLGADLEVTSYQPFSEEQRIFIDSLGGERSSQTRFASMVYFPRTNGTRLVQIRGLEGDYPYYGKIETEPYWASGDMTNGNYALVDEKVMLQHNVELGDEIIIGEANFIIRGKLRSVPGQSGIAMSIAPVVYIEKSYLPFTGLIQKGSRVTYSLFFKFKAQLELENLLARFEHRFKPLNLSYDTVEKRKKDTTTAFANMNVYLNLTAFVALLLGSIGVAGAVYIYLQEKKESVAILRCLGVKGQQAFYIYLIQVFTMGLTGSIIGISLGLGMQYGLPKLLSDILPVTLPTKIYWNVAIEGFLLGVLITILFGLSPLVSLKKISPLQSIRRVFDPKPEKISQTAVSIYGCIVMFLYGFAYLQVGEWKQALFFLIALGVTFLLLFGISQLMMKMARRLSAKAISFNVKQGIANLHRPNNQTSVLLLTIGICTVLISTLLFSRYTLVQQIMLTGEGERPNMVLFDIQTKQKEEVKALTLDYDLPIMQEVPVVTMRLKEIRGITKVEAGKDTTLEIPNWAYSREYRVTFRDELIDSETLSEGELQTGYVSEDSILISVSEGFAKRLKWEIGDEILFNVQGALLKTYIGSFRKIDWQRVQTNFLILFPSGILEDAPQFHVLVTKVDESEVSARFQQAVVTLFPNVSIIDLELILETLEQVLSKISFAINFMAGFSVLTGLIVLAGSVVLSKTQRIKESVLLRTLGASSRQVFMITWVEYLALGAIASLSGLILANSFSFLLAKFVFENDFIFTGYYTALIFVSVTFGTITIGLFNIRSVLRKSPLEILRKEI